MAFIDATGEAAPYASEILKCEIEAFPAGDWYDNKTSFAVNMICDGLVNFTRIRFYCDMDLTVNTETLHDGLKMYRCEVYRITD